VYKTRVISWDRGMRSFVVRWSCLKAGIQFYRVWISANLLVFLKSQAKRTSRHAFSGDSGILSKRLCVYIFRQNSCNLVKFIGAINCHAIQITSRLTNFVTGKLYVTIPSVANTQTLFILVSSMNLCGEFALKNYIADGAARLFIGAYQQRK